MQNLSLSIFAKSKEVWLICSLSALAAAHVLVFSAAFPFFNTDEFYHFDLAVKYSHLDLPKKQDYLAHESLEYIVVFSTWEYLLTQDTVASPPWTQPMSQIAPLLASREVRWRIINYETVQPPLYYVAAGAWWRLWSALGFHDAFLLYLLRFFNVLVVVALVWLGWLTGRLVFPENIFVRVSLPALLALMPQSIFYFVDNDVLSPLCFGAAFFCLLRLWFTEIPTKRLAVALGLALAATFLTKSTNLPLLAVAGAIVALKIWKLCEQGKLRESLASLGFLFICAGLPVAGWMIWSKMYFGHFLASSEIAKQFGWTVKPFSQWWNHPIFTPSGMWAYLEGQLGTFWQGECLWHGQSMALLWTNCIYTTFSLVLVAVVLPSLVPRFSNATLPQRYALFFSVGCFAAALAFFGLLSIVYDFHDCVNPSREHPFFQAGRMLLGMLIPFLLLLVYGLDCILDKLGNVLKFMTLIAIISAMVALEIVTDWPVFFSRYNWFHM